MATHTHEAQMTQLEEDGFLHCPRGPGAVMRASISSTGRSSTRSSSNCATMTVCRDFTAHTFANGSRFARNVDTRWIPHSRSATVRWDRPIDTNQHRGRSRAAQVVRRSWTWSECILGSEITANPVQHARIKLPASRCSHRPQRRACRQDRMHQDLAAVRPIADATDEPTVWAAMDRCKRGERCLSTCGAAIFGPGIHCQPDELAGAVVQNIPTKYIYETEAVPIPVKRGDIHRPHHADQAFVAPRQRQLTDRGAFDLRYQRTGQQCGRPGSSPPFPFVTRCRIQRHLGYQVWRGSMVSRPG